MAKCTTLFVFFLNIYCPWFSRNNSISGATSLKALRKESLVRHVQCLCPLLTSPQTSPVFTALLMETFLEPQMCMNSVFLIFLLVSLLYWNIIYAILAYLLMPTSFIHWT